MEGHLDFGLPARMADVFLQEVAVLRMNGGRRLDGSENSLLDFRVGVGEGEHFIATSHWLHSGITAPGIATRRCGYRHIVMSSFNLLIVQTNSLINRSMVKKNNNNKNEFPFQTFKNEQQLYRS